MMSNPCISRHMFGPLPRLQTSGRFAGVGDLSSPFREIWATAARRRSRAHDYGISKDLTNRWSQPLAAPMTNSQHFYEACPRSDKRDVDLTSDTLPFGRLWYAEPNAISNAIDYVSFSAARMML